MKHTYTYHGQTHTLDLEPTANGYRVKYNGETYEVRQLRATGRQLVLCVQGHMVTLHTAKHDRERWVDFDGHTYTLEKPIRARRRGGGQQETENVLRAPMPGQVRAVQAAEGDEVETGQTLLILEAMKMEIRIQSPCDGVVESIPVAVGEQVEKDQILVEIG